MGDLTDALGFIVICIVGVVLCLGLIAGMVIVGGRFSSGITLGQEYQTVGYIRLYEHSSWIEPHTWVVLETHGGVSAEVTLLGYHEFNVGEPYQINTICRRGGLWGTTNWYEVTDIQSLQG